MPHAEQLDEADLGAAEQRPDIQPDEVGHEDDEHQADDDDDDGDGDANPANARRIIRKKAEIHVGPL